MILSTKKLFSSKKRIIINKKNSTYFCKSNIKLKEALKSNNTHTSNNKGKTKLNNNDALLYKINPFSSFQKKYKYKINLNLSSKFELSKFKNFKKKTEFNNTKKEIYSSTKIKTVACSKKKKQIQDEFDIDKLCQEFKNSELKTAFVIDNNGNNNLNSKQKKIIGNYFEKKYESLQKNIDKCKINHKKEIKLDFYEKKNIRGFNFGRRFLSPKQNIGFINVLQKSVRKINKKYESKDNNSLFETLSDSSFVDSSENEEKNLISALKDKFN